MLYVLIFERPMHKLCLLTVQDQVDMQLNIVCPHMNASNMLKIFSSRQTEKLFITSPIQLHDHFHCIGRILFFFITLPPSWRVCRGQNRHQVSPPQRHQSSKRGSTLREPRGIEMGPRASSSVGCAGCKNSQPTRSADET